MFTLVHWLDNMRVPLTMQSSTHLLSVYSPVSIRDDMCLCKAFSVWVHSFLLTALLYEITTLYLNDVVNDFMSMQGRACLNWNLFPPVSVWGDILLLIAFVSLWDNLFLCYQCLYKRGHISVLTVFVWDNLILCLERRHFCINSDSIFL